MKSSLIASVLSFALLSPLGVLAAENIGSQGSENGTLNVTGEVQAGVAVPKFIDVTKEAKVVGGLDECRAACRQNNQSNPDALNACLRACGAVGPASGARLLPTVNKKTDSRDAATGQSSGKRQHKPMMIIKEWDAATPLLMQRSQERKEDLQERRDEMKEKMEEQREKMKERLAAFKNKTKAAIAERIADSLNKLNERLTNHFANQIDKMEEIMVGVAAGDVDGDGTADITAANQAIADADAAVSVQASKNYTVAVSTEANVKVDVGVARQQLHDDLKAVEEKVKAAREAVRKAASHVDKPAASANASSSGSVQTNTQ